MYTIHAKIDDQMYRLLFALLPVKMQAVHTQLLTKLKTYMADLQLFMNFETAAHNAARTVFPGITVKGCFFHYTQVYGEKLNTLVYKSPTKTMTFDNLWEEQLLPLLSTDLIEDVCFNALNDLDDIDTLANTTTFTNYYTTDWIDGDWQIWNHFNTDVPRTINHIEGWHNKLK